MDKHEWERDFGVILADGGDPVPPPPPPPPPPPSPGEVGG